jgi:pyruvate/2-oxoglutarate dehydrogenase complex dihydrolipoamide dehydrogenase (E3) component
VAETAEYDAIIIGSGQAGGPLARAFAESGKRAAIIECEHVGGTCVNEGCTPTKTMVASARVAYVEGRASSYGIPVSTSPTDMSIVRQRKRDIVDDFSSSSQRKLEKEKNLDLIWGEASFVGEHLVEVKTFGPSRTLTAPTIVINAGARPAVPDVPGLSDVPFLNSTTIMELDIVPEHLIILGAGYVGMEFAQMFRRFGSRVTVVQRSGHVLDREDEDVAAEIENILRGEGIEFIFNAEARRISQTEGKGVRVELHAGDGDRAIEGSHLLVATGRVPNTERLNLAAAGVAVDDHGFIKVDEHLRTSAEGIYAAGDIKGGPAFTHISYDDFRILQANLLEGGDRTTTGRLVPYTVFIDPQLGRVGMTEAEARKAGRKIKVAKLPMTEVARALETDETRGFMKAVVDAGTEQILGCSILGIDGGEIMGALQIAMMGKLRYSQIRDAIFAHPTLVESLNNLFMTL